MTQKNRFAIYFIFTFFFFFLISGWLLSQETGANEKKTEVTPKELPGSEAFVYRDIKPEPVRLFVFKPKDWKKSDKRTALIYFFGGGWTHGTPDKGASLAKWAVGFDWVGIAPDYRTKNRYGTSPLESVADARKVLAWAEEHAEELGIDPRKIVVGGTSAGGHIALWTAIEHSPPGSDPSEAPKYKPMALLLNSPAVDTSVATGYTPTRFGTNADALSALHQLDKNMPPTLLIHGDADALIAYRTAVDLNKNLTESGNICQFITVPGGTHGVPEWKDKVRDLMKDFLVKEKILSLKTATLGE
jgi:acetyl esterase/lipase